MFLSLVHYFNDYVYFAAGDGRVATHACPIQFGCTAVIWAAREAHADCVRILVEAGANSDAVDLVCHMICICMYRLCNPVSRNILIFFTHLCMRSFPVCSWQIYHFSMRMLEQN